MITYRTIFTSLTIRIVSPVKLGQKKATTLATALMQDFVDGKILRTGTVYVLTGEGCAKAGYLIDSCR